MYCSLGFPNVHHGSRDDLGHKTCLDMEGRIVQLFAADVTNSGAVDWFSDDLVNHLTDGDHSSSSNDHRPQPFLWQQQFLESF